ncbi:GNAT family N-acetyltransferase [Candidatus Enterococcus lowellii]|uniref:GNAT family N-acetyltransferase n=1 Tax=Candidatus Enterococcus lowellii TaxID=2230877 RepID=UPI003BB0ACD2
MVVTKYDKLSKTMEIGHVIDETWWANSYTSEALIATVNFLFKPTDVQKIEDFHDITNNRS